MTCASLFMTCNDIGTDFIAGFGVGPESLRSSGYEKRIQLEGGAQYIRQTMRPYLYYTDERSLEMEEIERAAESGLFTANAPSFASESCTSAIRMILGKHGKPTMPVLRQ